MARKPQDNTSTANIGFEQKLWLAADKLRSNMDAAEYKHVVLGLIFLKYISDTFEEHRAKLLAGQGDYAGANAEDPDEYKAENVFWVPADARWSHLQASAKQPTIGKTVDDAMVAIERDNPRLKGVLPKDYARPGLDTATRDSASPVCEATSRDFRGAKDHHRLGELIDVIATIELTAASEGEKTHRSVDLLGRVYEYFLTMFASAEGKNGGQFYTPSCVVRCLVEMLAPYKGRIYDPACGSGGMFVQSEKFADSHGGKLGTLEWATALLHYLASRETLKHEIARMRDLACVPVTLPDGSQVALSPGGQNPFIKAIIEKFSPAFAPSGEVLYIVNGKPALEWVMERQAVTTDNVQRHHQRRQSLGHRDDGQSCVSVGTVPACHHRQPGDDEDRGGAAGAGDIASRKITSLEAI